MSYGIFILPRAHKELAKLPRGVFEHVRDDIRALVREPRPRGCSKLTGRDGWRIRVGDYRMIYEIDDERQMITILHIGHRRDVYR